MSRAKIGTWLCPKNWPQRLPHWRHPDTATYYLVYPETVWKVATYNKRTYKRKWRERMHILFDPRNSGRLRCTKWIARCSDWKKRSMGTKTLVPSDKSIVMRSARQPVLSSFLITGHATIGTRRPNSFLLHNYVGDMKLAGPSYLMTDTWNLLGRGVTVEEPKGNKEKVMTFLGCGQRRVTKDIETPDGNVRIEGVEWDASRSMRRCVA